MDREILLYDPDDNELIYLFSSMLFTLERFFDGNANKIQY